MSLIALLLGSPLAGSPRPAGADPTADLTSQARDLAQQIDATNEYISGLGERYDGIQLKLQEAQQAAAQAHADIDALGTRIRELQHLVGERAASSYQAELSGESLAPLDLPNAEQLATRDRYASLQSKRDDANLRALNDQQHALLQREADAQSAQSDADIAAKQLDEVKAQLVAANAQRVGLLSQVQGALALALPSAEQSQAAAALAIALAKFAPGAAGGDPGLFPGLPAVSPQAALAIAYAQAQLGKPYLYAAAGPSSFDCSGLVMAAYAFAGVRLPHYSGAQYALLPHIPLLEAQPGDLLFWGVGGSEHVAIYVGLGRILEAGGTGNDVHVGPIWGQPVGAARVI